MLWSLGAPRSKKMVIPEKPVNAALCDFSINQANPLAGVMNLQEATNMAGYEAMSDSGR